MSVGQQRLRLFRGFIAQPRGGEPGGWEHEAHEQRSEAARNCSDFAEENCDCPRSRKAHLTLRPPNGRGCQRLGRFVRTVGRPAHCLEPLGGVVVDGLAPVVALEPVVDPSCFIPGPIPMRPCSPSMAFRPIS